MSGSLGTKLAIEVLDVLNWLHNEADHKCSTDFFLRRFAGVATHPV